MLQFDWSLLAEQRTAIWHGLLTTLFISFLSSGIAVMLGLMVALGRKSPVVPLQWLLNGYVQFFRNTPLLVQLYFYYKGLPQLGITWTPFVCGVVALSLHAAAYVAEIFRTGLEAIPQEQLEGGIALGFTRRQTYFNIILPQALGILLPPLGNQVVGLVKNSSLVAFITVTDLFYVVFNGAASQFYYLEYFTVGVAGYVGLTLAVSGLFLWLEQCIPVVQRMRAARHAL